VRDQHGREARVTLPQELAKSVAEGAFEFAPGWSFADPWLLLFAPVAWLCLWRGRGESGRAEARATLVERVPASWRSNTRFVPFVLSALAAACVAVALARPLRGEVRSDSESEGVDIALVVDRSGSMQHKDLDPKRSRLEVVKQVVGDFAARRMQDKEGAADQCALIVFAAYPQILCPYTLDVDAIRGFIEELQPVQNRQEDGTGIGVGLAKAVQTLAGSEAKSKVAVLLTDGENNIDSIAPLEAADLAAKSGVKVYTIFAGRYAYAFDAFGRAVPTRREIDTTELRRIAERTGGLHFRARDQAELERAYAQIESLERTKRVVSRRVENYDAYKALLLPALLLQLLAFLGWRTIWRTLP
jgi:Ca-activated chloride channel family protein